MPLLCRVDFDMPGPDRGCTALIPANENACKAAIAIRRMADTLNIKMCAKGTENRDRFEFFGEIGACRGQGP